MSNNCSCKYKCGNADITFSESEVYRYQRFAIKIKPYKKYLDPAANTASKIAYTPSKKFEITARSGNEKLELNIPDYEWTDNQAVIEDCYFTSEPTNDVSSVSVTISIKDPTTPSEGDCASENITLKKWQLDEGLYEIINGVATQRSTNPNSNYMPNANTIFSAMRL